MTKILLNINTTKIPIIRGEGYISGVGRSTQCLVDSFALAKYNDLIVETCFEGLEYINSKVDAVGLKNHKILLPYRFSAWYRNVLLSYDFYHYPNNYFARTAANEKYILTVHDVIQYNRALAAGNYEYANKMRENVIKACGIITCSLYSKKKIVETFSCDSDKVVVIPWGVNMDKFRKLKVETIEKCLHEIHIPDLFFLAVSCSDSRKNIANLLEAFSIYNKTGNISLVLLWNEPSKMILDKYAGEIAQGRIVFQDYVTDDQLVALYNKALCTMFPSREEGFGFPILESFACGTPVMTCKNSSLQEVGGEYAFYVGEDDISGMVDVMKMVESGETVIDDKCLCAYASSFSWQRTADMYADYYRSL